jgi:uncharacterized metal-binding protein YceD (DUF177 family)
MAGGMSAPEFSCPVRAHEVGGHARDHAIAAETAECAALATRFDLLALQALSARLRLVREAAGIRLTGDVAAEGAQACVATGAPVPFRLITPLSLLLVEAGPSGQDIELGDDDLDVELLEGDVIDLGEWAAQAMALALDPYPRSNTATPGVLSEDEAAQARSPFAVLKTP